VYARFEIQTHTHLPDPRGERLLENLKFEYKLKSIRVSDICWVETTDLNPKELLSAIREACLDPVLNLLVSTNPPVKNPDENIVFEKRFHIGVTDNRSRTILEALEIICGKKLQKTRLMSGTLYIIELFEPISEEKKSNLARSYLYNQEIEDHTWIQNEDRFSELEIKKHFRTYSNITPPVQLITMTTLSDSDLIKISRDRLLSLNLEEMKTIQSHYRGLNQEPTDVEIEILAQTWSEHCKHKIFAGEITYVDQLGIEKIPPQIKSLFKTTIKGTTDLLPKPWLLSVFSDNAGIVAMTEDDAVCIKVETHNSPSALDPVGGAMTGIVGVNRDILGSGLGAKPIFNTNVFCVAPLEHSGALPERLLHPRRILEGIRHGIEMGGNQSGIPTVNGAIIFDESYLGKPLVYCGSGGILPRKILGRDCTDKTVKPGDLVVMAGGRIGKDGINGATFSSLELTQNAPASAVQMGDPITQKRLSDFLLEARDLGLYRAVTDNGAGGLSSSIGEMATHSGGAKIDLSLAPTKYPGLSPYELVISESQERMTFAVDPKTWDAFSELASRRGVEVCALGEFTDQGLFEIFYANKQVANLSMEFLHEGVPTLKLNAKWDGIKKPTRSTQAKPSIIGETWEKILALPNIRSKEEIIRQYDHEVQGTSVVKPMSQSLIKKQTAPNDAAVLALKPGSKVGISVGCGILPEYSKYDAYKMAEASVDEAVRNLLCVGSEFSLGEDSVMALIDNFCWPDPMVSEVYASDLVRACFGLKKAALELGLPFISGKDSMKNDYRGKLNGQPITVSVTPTLLITALGRLPDFETQSRTSSFKKVGDQVFLLGPHQMSLLGSQWGKIFAHDATDLPPTHWEVAKKLYCWLGSEKSQVLSSCHDVSEGGLLTTLFESSAMNGLGLKFDLDPKLLDSPEFCFGEGFHTFLVSVDQKQADSLKKEWIKLGLPFLSVGTTQAKPEFMSRNWNQSLTQLNLAYRGGIL
jgi:phosphoribosylformylglycinamidine synthase II